MTVAAQTTLRGRARPLDRHPIRLAVAYDDQHHGAHCETCGRRVQLRVVWMRDGRGVQFLAHTGPRA